MPNWLFEFEPGDNSRIASHCISLVVYILTKLHTRFLASLAAGATSSVRPNRQYWKLVILALPSEAHRTDTGRAAVMLMDSWAQTRLSTIEFEEFRLPRGVRNRISSRYRDDGWAPQRFSPPPPYAPRYQFPVEIISKRLCCAEDYEGKETGGHAGQESQDVANRPLIAQIDNRTL